MNENYDLEVMREQMNTLRKKLEQQEIVNDRIIRKSMNRNMSKINRRYYFIMALGLLMIPYGYWAFVMMGGLSLAFWIGTCIFMLICVGATFYNGKDLRDPGLMRNSLVEVRRKMARAKKFDSDWLLIGIPMIILWLVWFGWEAYKKGGENEVITFLYAGTVGGLVGLIIGLRIHFKTQHNYQEIIDEIEDMTDE